MKYDLINLIEQNNSKTEGLVKLIDIESYVDKLLQYATIICAYESGTLSGFIGYYSNDKATLSGYISVLVVDKQYRNRKIAEKLMKYTISDLKDKGFERCRLEVLKENKRALSLYEKIGFKIIAENKDKWLMNSIL